MRKLIWAGIITILAAIAWLSYLQYDINRFEEELSQDTPEQREKSTTQDALETLPDDVVETTQVETTQAESENTLPDLRGEKIEDVAQPIENDADALKSDQTSENIGLSPEIKSFFVAYKAYRKQCMQVNDKLNPITKEYKSLIDQLLNTPENYSYQESILVENLHNRVIKDLKSVETVLMPLQEERDRIYEEGLKLFSENGFTSEEEFRTVYGEIYDVWAADPTRY